MSQGQFLKKNDIHSENVEPLVKTRQLTLNNTYKGVIQLLNQRLLGFYFGVSMRCKNVTRYL